MAASRPTGDAADPVVATAVTLKRMAARHHYLDAEIKQTDAELARIIADHAPALLEINGVGAAVASQLLVTIGDNPERLASEAPFAALTGTAPIPASSGKTTRTVAPAGRTAPGPEPRVVKQWIVVPAPPGAAGACGVVETADRRVRNHREC